jgi:hypothetical protein
MYKLIKMAYLFKVASVLLVFLFAAAQLNAKSVFYDFNDSIPPGIVVNNAPHSVEQGALKIEIDKNSQKWTASILVTVEQDIFNDPSVEIRFRINKPVNATANLPITLKIDDLYTSNGYSGTWRLYPAIDLSSDEWQILKTDLTPLIDSWEATNGQEHGNIRELTIFIGNNNGPFVAEELYIDYIRLGADLSVNNVLLNPDNLREIIVDVGVPLISPSSLSGFTVKRDETSLPIDSVFVSNESKIVVLLKNTLNIPREVLDLPDLKLIYNGDCEIKDTNDRCLEAFQENVSFTAYAENLWKYWGKYKFSDKPVQPEWVNTNTVTEGWDWSLPEFVEADEFASFWYRNSPNLNVPWKNLNSVYVNWNELEPNEGEYNFELLRKRIIDNSEGYDGVTLRLLAAVWEINSYPSPGGFVPDWLASRKNAPRWMDNLDIAKIPAHKSIDGKYLITNMDIMDPDYHSRYIRFIEALGKSGIPEMEELKIVNVCYRSSSAGEEFTAYNPEHNTVEAQYSSAEVAQRTRERLKVWADAFGDNRYKLMYVGTTEQAQISYAGELGIGSRHGFVEMYNANVDMPQFGFTINSDRYVDVDENNNFIKKNVAFGDENEEYTNELRFGWKESFPYRYYMASFRMLQQRRNYVMHAENTLNPELTWYVGMGLARQADDAPDAWAMLSESYLNPFANNGKAGPLKNMERWLYQRDKPGYETTPAMKVPTAKDLWYADNTRPYDFTARKGKKIGFDIDDRIFPNGEQPIAIKVSFYDGVNGTMKLVYKNNQGIQADSVVTTGQDGVRTATFFINARIDDAGFDYDFDFLLESEEEVSLFFVRVIKTKAVYTSVRENKGFDKAIHVYPNPFSTWLKLSRPGSSDINFEIIDVFGRTLINGNLNQSSVIHTNNWETGIYFMKVDGQNKTLKLIKR